MFMKDDLTTNIGLLDWIMKLKVETESLHHLLSKYVQ